ncbi:MAG TPA: hypothetical protein VN703_04955, partial [Candidatus Sulfopaludibacter sp.]|nr:hypothetical protein [Candidatus Sulfopaludibacter sp.]
LSPSLLPLSFKRMKIERTAAINELIINIQLEYIILLSGSAKIIIRFVIDIKMITTKKKKIGFNYYLFFIDINIFNINQERLVIFAHISET